MKSLASRSLSCKKALQKEENRWFSRTLSFVLAFLLLFTAMPTHLIGGTHLPFFGGHGHTNEAYAAEVLDSAESIRNELYRPAPEDFSFSETSTSEYADLELTEISEISNVFLDPQTGQETEVFFSQPARYIGEDGDFIDFDPSLVESDKEDVLFENASGNKYSYFPQVITTDTPITLVNGQWEIAFSPQQPEPVSFLEVVDEPHEDVYGNTEVLPMAVAYDIDAGNIYKVKSSDIGVKEEIILDAVPTSNEFSYDLAVKGLVATLDEVNSSIVFFDEDEPDKIAAIIPEGLMWDSSEEGNYSRDMEYRLEQTGDCSYVFTVVVSKDYLEDEARVYPVHIDPEWAWYNTYAESATGRGLSSTFVRSGSGHTSKVGTRVVLKIGKNGEGNNRSYLQAQNFASVLSGKSINSAVLTLNQINNSSFNKNLSIDIHRVDTPTSSQTNDYNQMCWSNRPLGDTNPMLTKSLGTSSYVHTFDVTAWVRNVAKGSYGSHGLMLKQSNEDNALYTEFEGATGNSSKRPTLKVIFGDAPTAPTVTLSNSGLWKSGQTPLTMTWTGVSANTTVSSMQMRIISGTTIDAAGVHTTGSTVVKDWTAATNPAPTVGTSGFSMPTTYGTGCYRVQLRAIDAYGAVGDFGGQWFHVDNAAPTLTMAAVPVAPAGTASGAYSKTIPTIAWSAAKDTPFCNAKQVKLDVYVKRPDGTTSTARNVKALAASHAAGSAAFNSSEFLPSQAGPYTAYLKATDRSDNVSLASYPFYYDIQPPKLGLKVLDANKGTLFADSTTNTTVQTAQIVSKVIRVERTIADEKDGQTSGFTKGNIKIEGITETSYVRNESYSATTSTNITIDTKSSSYNMDDGIYKMTFSGQDKAGNIATPAVCFFQVSNSQPAPSLIPALDQYFINNTSDFQVTWALPPANPLTRTGIEWTLIDKGNFADSDSYLNSLSWTTVQTTDERGTITLETPKDSNNNPHEGTWTLLARSTGPNGKGKLAQVDLQVLLTGPELSIDSFDSGIVEGSVSSPLLRDYELLIKEKGQPDSSFESFGEGSEEASQTTLGFVDLAKDYPVGLFYTIRLAARDKAGNQSKYDFDVYNAVADGGLTADTAMSISGPASGIVSTSQESFSIESENIQDFADFTWFLNGRNVESDNSVTMPPVFEQDFSQPDPYLEGSYHTLLGAAQAKGQWQEGMPQSSTIKSGTASIALADENLYSEITDGSFTGNIFTANSGTTTAVFTTREINTALPFTALTFANIPAGINVDISSDGQDWEVFSRSGNTLKWSVDSNDNLIYKTNFKLRFTLDTGTATSFNITSLEASANFVSPDIFQVNFLSRASATNLSARDKLDYKTHFYWEVGQDSPEGLSYEIYSMLGSKEAAQNFPLSYWAHLATGLTENYFASPNYEFNRYSSYIVVPVRAQTLPDGTSVKRMGTPSNIDTTRPVAENELTKRLGIQDYWAYEAIDSPTGSVQVEKSQGNLVFQQTDRQLETDSLLQDGITRTYNAQSSLVFPFGQGTDFSYNVELLRQTNYQHSGPDTEASQRYSYIFKDDTGTLRTFSYNDDDGSYFTSDSKRTTLEVFDAPKAVQVRTKTGIAEASSHCDTLLVKYVVTLYKKTEYWFNQGGQLVYITDAPGQLAKDLPQGQIEYVTDHTRQNLTFSYDSQSGLLKSATSGGLRSLHFSHNTDRLIDAVWLPDQTVITYSYTDKRLEEVRLHENLVSETDFLAGTKPGSDTKDVAYTYTWESMDSLASLFYGGNSYFMKSVQGVLNDGASAAPETSFDYASFDWGDSIRVVSATNPLGDTTKLTYNLVSGENDTCNTESLVTYVPTGSSDPNAATKTILNYLGHPEYIEVGTVEDVTAGQGQKTIQTWSNHLLDSTTVNAEYHELAPDGTVVTHVIPRTSYTTYNLDLLPDTTVEPSGITVVSGYDGEGINEEEVTSETSYDEFGEISEESQWEFDEAGFETKALEITFESKTDIVNYSDGRVKSELVSLQKYENGEPVVGGDAPQSLSEYTYDKYGNTAEEVTTEYGSPNVVQTTRKTYDAFGRVLTEEAGFGRGAILSEVRSIDNSYDRQGRLTGMTITEPDGTTRTTSTVYNKDGSVAYQVDEDGITTAFTYDNAGRTTSTKTSTPTIGGKEIADKITTTEYGYEDVTVNVPGGTKAYVGAKTVTSTDPAGLVTKSYSDALGRTIRLYGSGINTDTTYTSDGKTFATIELPTNMLRHNAKEALTLYDQNGNQTHAIQAPLWDGNSYRQDIGSIATSSSFDAQGKTTSSIDALENETFFTYDQKGELAQVTLPKAEYIHPSNQASYEARSVVEYVNEEITAGGKTTTTKDALKRESKLITDPSGKTLSLTDYGDTAKGDTPIATSYEYNPKGELIKEAYSGGDCKTFSYDSKGNLEETKWIKANGAVELSSTNTYNTKGRLTSIADYEWAGGQSSVIYYQEFDYDIAGKLTASFEGHAKPVSITDSQKTHYSYDSADRLVGLDYPDSLNLEPAPLRQSYSFDEHGRLEAISTIFKDGTEEKTIPTRKYTYDSWGRVERIKDCYNPNADQEDIIIKNYRYDLFDRVAEIEYSFASDPQNIFESFEYSYSKDSNITSERHLVDIEGLPYLDEVRTYSYNNTGQLIRSESSESGVCQYGYDQAGNRRREVSGNVTTWSDFNGLNQLKVKQTGSTTTVYSYDAKGNQISESQGGIVTRKLVYDTENRLTEVQALDNGSFSTTNTNTYRGDGRRIARAEDGTVTKYVYNQGSVLNTLDSSNNIINFYYSTPDGSPYLVQTPNSEESSFVAMTKDIRSSTNTVVDNTGQVRSAYKYSDFGQTEEIVGSDLALDIAYTGGIWDRSTDLYYLNARYYNPEDGRFLTQDSARNGGDIAATQSLYGYCEGSPISFTDPSGLCKQNLQKHLTKNGKKKWPGPEGSGLKITLKGNTVNIEWRVKFIGSNHNERYPKSKMTYRQAFEKGIEKHWSGKFTVMKHKNVKVKTNVKPVTTNCGSVTLRRSSGVSKAENWENPRTVSTAVKMFNNYEGVKYDMLEYQRTAAHEFGHVLGIDDTYLASANGNTTTAKIRTIMGNNEFSDKVSNRDIAMALFAYRDNQFYAYKGSSTPKNDEAEYVKVFK